MRGKAATDLRAKALADRAAGEYTKMLARLGRYPELKAFLAEVGDRKFIGHATELMMAGKDGAVTMESRPDISFRCGPVRLEPYPRSPELSAPGRPGHHAGTLHDARNVSG